MKSHARDSLARMLRELEAQDEAWSRVRARLAALGDVPIQVDPEALFETDRASTLSTPAEVSHVRC